MANKRNSMSAARRKTLRKLINIKSKLKGTNTWSCPCFFYCFTSCVNHCLWTVNAATAANQKHYEPLWNSIAKKNNLIHSLIFAFLNKFFRFPMLAERSDEWFGAPQELKNSKRRRFTLLSLQDLNREGAAREARRLTFFCFRFEFWRTLEAFTTNALATKAVRTLNIVWTSQCEVHTVWRPGEKAFKKWIDERRRRWWMFIAGILIKSRPSL